MTGRKSKNNKHNYNRPNFWGMIQNVCITAINRGQFLLAISWTVVVIILIRLPKDGIVSLVDNLFNLQAFWGTLGWILFVLSAGGWVYNAKYLRRIHAKEMNRVSKEKTDLQNKILPKQSLKSSKKRK